MARTFFGNLARCFCACLFLATSSSLFAQPDNLATKSQRAKELMAAGSFEDAIPIYEELARALPNNPGLIMNLGLALHMAGHDRQAIPQFQSVLKLDPANIPARLFLGAAYLGIGEPAKAIEPLRKVIRAQPGNPEARELLAQSLSSLARFDEVAEHFQKLAELNPENPRAWYGLGKTYEALARRAFHQLDSTAAQSAHWLMLVAESRARQHQYSSAFFLYRQALAKAPAMRGAHAALAEIYRNAGHADWAAVEDRKEQEIGPPDCSTVAALSQRRETAVGRPPLQAPSTARNSKIANGKSTNGGGVSTFDFRLSEHKLECDFLAGRYLGLLASAKRIKTAESYYWLSRAYNELAVQAFSRLSNLPESAEAHELKAEIYRNQRQYLESAREWQAALKLSPGDPHNQKELATTLNLAGDRQAARKLLEDLLNRQPNSAELNFLLGDTLLNLQRAEESIPYLKRALERHPKLLAAHASLARAYLEIGKSERAIAHLKAALRTDEDGSLHYQLARAYQSSGQPEQAKEMLEKYREIRNALAAERKTTEEEVQITPP